MEKSLPADDYASGAWVGKPGHEEEFIERWIEFLEWTRQTFHELNKAILIRDTDEPNRFVWLAYWGERGRHGLVAISQRFRPATGSLPSLLRRVLRKHYEIAASV